MSPSSMLKYTEFGVPLSLLLFFLSIIIIIIIINNVDDCWSYLSCFRAEYKKSCNQEHTTSNGIYVVQKCVDLSWSLNPPEVKVVGQVYTNMSMTMSVNGFNVVH